MVSRSWMVGLFFGSMMVGPVGLAEGDSPAGTEAHPDVSAAAEDASGKKESRPGALEVKDEYTGRNRLGVVAGLSSGIGGSYCHYFTDNFALRAGGYVFLLNATPDEGEASGDQEASEDRISVYSLGLMAQLDINRMSNYQLYGVAGVGVMHGDWNRDPTSEALGLGVFPGVGVGLEVGYHYERSITWQVELVLTGMFMDGEFARLLPLPQVGVHYNF